MATRNRASGRQNRPDFASIAKTIVIRASVTVLTKASFQNAASIEVIEFESGSQLRRLETGAFSLCRSLKSICIAASVEFIGKACFVDLDDLPHCWSNLETVRFEKGSKLREIEPMAFAYCRLLKSLLIPASVEKMNGGSLPSPSCQIELEFGNGHKYFGREGGFLIDLDHDWILRYQGGESDVRIPDKIEKIDERCFESCCWICSVTFGSKSKLFSIEQAAFRYCGNLKAIEIPSSVASLGVYCFYGCQSLQVVLFCSGSALNCIPDWGFAHCSELESIIIPSTVKTIGACSFLKCQKLALLQFPVDSELVRIENMAFRYCSSLESLILPPSVEFVGEGAFVECVSFSSLMFGSPSHLRELLAIPVVLSGFLSIPDSVEVLGSFGTSPFAGDRVQVLSFGAESRLRAIRIPRHEDGDLLFCYRSFLRVSTRTLRIFRMNLEFETIP
jgi:hypothetical protein